MNKKFSVPAMLAGCFALILTIALPFVSPAAPAFAQDAQITGVESAHLWLYPEYDDPRLLVMMEGTVTGAEAPVQVQFLVPTDAQMYSAGSMDDQGTYSGGPPDREPSQIDGWDIISYTLTSNTYRVEYYDPIITGEADKAISYDFRTLYPIADMEAVVQQPVTATDFTVSPSGQASTLEGFTVYTSNLTHIGTSDSVHFDISYIKTDTRPSLTILSEGEQTSGGFPWGIAVVVGVVAAIAAGVFFWMRTPSPNSRPGRRQAARNSGTARATRTKNSPPKGGYCPGCGKPLEGGENFCPYCGTKL